MISKSSIMASAGGPANDSPFTARRPASPPGSESNIYHDAQRLKAQAYYALQADASAAADSDQAGR